MFSGITLAVCQSYIGIFSRSLKRGGRLPFTRHSNLPCIPKCFMDRRFGALYVRAAFLKIPVKLLVFASSLLFFKRPAQREEETGDSVSYPLRCYLRVVILFKPPAAHKHGIGKVVPFVKAHLFSAGFPFNLGEAG